MSEQELIRSKLMALARSACLGRDLTVTGFNSYTVNGIFVGGGRTLPLNGLSPGEAEDKMRDFVAKEKLSIAEKKT